jgi:hypothetical protein
MPHVCTPHLLFAVFRSNYLLSSNFLPTVALRKTVMTDTIFTTPTDTAVHLHTYNIRYNALFQTN